MAKVQTSLTSKTGFDLASNFVSSNDVATVAEAVAENPPKRGLKLSLPSLARKIKVDGDAAKMPELPAAKPIIEPEPVTSERGFKLSLPKLSRKPDKVDATPAVKVARNKAAFQTAPLLSDAEDGEKSGLGDKIRLFMALLTPSEREPKAFAGRPDPFERLAADARRDLAR